MCPHPIEVSQAHDKVTLEIEVPKTQEAKPLEEEFHKEPPLQEPIQMEQEGKSLMYQLRSESINARKAYFFNVDQSLPKYKPLLAAKEMIEEIELDSLPQQAI